MAFTIGGYTIPQIRKTLVAAVGVAGLILAAVLADFADYIPQGAATVGASVVGFLTVAGVFLARMGTLVDGVGSNGFGNVPTTPESDAETAGSGKHRAV